MLYRIPLACDAHLVLQFLPLYLKEPVGVYS